MKATVTFYLRPVQPSEGGFAHVQYVWQAVAVVNGHEAGFREEPGDPWGSGGGWRDRGVDICMCVAPVEEYLQ